jgi:hypothetical protein
LRKIIKMIALKPGKSGPDPGLKFQVFEFAIKCLLGTGVEKERTAHRQKRTRFCRNGPARPAGSAVTNPTPWGKGVLP